MKDIFTIKNCKIVNEGDIFEGDILVKEGRFLKIGSDIECQGETIDAAGLFLFPGVIDDQVHFREPGLTERGNIKTESLSAVAGGTTSFMDMPNVVPPTLNLELWREKIKLGEQNASANFSFYMGTSNTNIDEIKDIDPKEDLFLNQYNQPFGIASLDAAGTTALFTREQFHLAKVNSRKYRVKEDKFYTIAPAQTYHAAADGNGDSAQAVGTISPGCMTKVTKHNIGKELFYPKAATYDQEALSAYPTVGFQPEYILWHAIALGDNNTSAAARTTPLGMTISCRPISTFKDT